MGRLSPHVSASILTCVGDDSLGDTIRVGLEAYGVHTETIQVCTGQTSPFTYILSAPVNRQMTRTCIHQPSSMTLSPTVHETILGRSLGDQDGDEETHKSKVPYTTIHFDGRYPSGAVPLARQCFQQFHIPYSVDVERPREGLLNLLHGASVVICNSKYCSTIGSSDTSGIKPNQSTSGNSSIKTKQKDFAERNRQDYDDMIKEKAVYDDTEIIVTRLRSVMKEQAPNAELAIQTMGERGCCLVRLNHPNDANEYPDGTIVLGTSSYNNSDETQTSDTKRSDEPIVQWMHGALFCSIFSNSSVVDTTGAGDAFQGGFLSALWIASTFVKTNSQQNGDSYAVEPLTDPIALSRALRIGTRVAAQKITQPGARKGLPCVSRDHFLQSELTALIEHLHERDVVGPPVCPGSQTRSN